MKNNLSFLLIADTSGSMYGEKIYALNMAVSNLLGGFHEISLDEENEPQMAIITYGGSPKLHTPFTPVRKIEFSEFEAYGDSTLTEALLLAKTIIKQKTTIILISDGSTNDGCYTRAIEDIDLKDKIYCIPVGFDADMDMLEHFAGVDGHILSLSDAETMAGYFLRVLSED